MGAIVDHNEQLKTVFQLKKEIETLLKKSEDANEYVSPQKGMVHITKLNLIDMTWEILEKTKIGFSVNDLRKACSNSNVNERGKRLLRKWKGLETNESTKSKKTMRDGGRNHHDHHDGATREHGTTACASSTSGVASDVSSIADANESIIKDDKPEYSEWGVRFAAEDGTGIKLIFAKRKRDYYEQKTELDRSMKKPATSRRR